VAFEIIKILLQTIWLTFNGLATVIWNCLPEILQLNKLLGYFTPAGMVGLYLGVPTGVISVSVFIVKKFVLSK
jgi:hypothetical protein